MPLIGFEDVPGEMFKELEQSGHGRRLIIADRCLDIDRRNPRNTVVEYRGRTSSQALNSVLRLCRREGPVTLMQPDPGDEREIATRAITSFLEVLRERGVEDVYGGTSRLNDGYNLAPRLNEHLNRKGRLCAETGFYSMLDKPEERRLFVVTPDYSPYACATFVVGHSQFGTEITPT